MFFGNTIQLVSNIVVIICTIASIFATIGIAKPELITDHIPVQLPDQIKALQTSDNDSCNARTINDKIADYQLTSDCIVKDTNGNVVAKNCKDLDNGNVYCAIDFRNKEVKAQDVQANDVYNVNTGGLPTNPQSEPTQSTECGSSIRVTNVHTWVSSNGQTVTAFAIKNTDCATSIDSIALRGIAVPQSNWYSCGPSCGTSTNMNTELTPDYNPENGVNLSSGTTAFTAGSLSLELGEGTIFHLVNAGNIQPIDAGNTYALQIQAGQASAVIQVQVVSTT